MNTYGLSINHTQDRLIHIDFTNYETFEEWLDDRASYYKDQATKAWENNEKPSQAWRRELKLAEKHFNHEGESVNLARFLLDGDNRKHLPTWLRSLSDKISAQYLSFPSLSAYRAARNAIADILEENDV